MIYIYLRHTLDWSDRAAVDAGLNPWFRSKLETWNATFGMPYHEFRRRLTEIARLNWSRVEGARLIERREIPPGSLLVPVDDDDWFAPELADRLAKARDSATRAYRWQRHILEPERHRRRFKTLLKELLLGKALLATNNYAVEESPGIGDVLLDHLQATRYFEAHVRRVKYLPRALSMQNRSLASQTALGFGEPSVTRDELVETLARYRTLYARTRLSPELRWAEPYVSSMGQLMQDLALR